MKSVTLPRLACCVGVALVGLTAVNSFATTLTFAPASGSFTDFVDLPQGYGNNVTSTTQDGFSYGLAGGATPNVVTQFGQPAGMVPLYTWDASFGDLSNVLIAREPIPFEFRLLADPGFLVTLNSFDMAGWPNLDFASIASVSVEDGLGNVLFSQTDVLIQGDANGPQHTHFDFSGISASVLVIKFDSTTDGHGHSLDSDDVGIDNINFSQRDVPTNVPEPGPLALLALGLVALMTQRRPNCWSRSGFHASLMRLPTP